MNACCCTYAQQVCPCCRRCAKDDAIFCQEAERTQVMCSGHRIVEIPGVLCPPCGGRRNTSRNVPHFNSRVLEDAGAATTGSTGNGRRRLSLEHILGFAAKDKSSSNTNSHNRSGRQSLVERLPSLFRGTTTAAAWRAQHQDVNLFASTKYASAAVSPNTNNMMGEVELDRVSLNDSQDTIWFPARKRVHVRTVSGQPTVVPAETVSQNTPAHNLLASPPQQGSMAISDATGSSRKPLAAAHVEESGQKSHAPARGERQSESRLERTPGSLLTGTRSDAMFGHGREPTPPIPERNPLRLIARTLHRQNSGEVTWSAPNARRSSAPGYVNDVSDLTSVPDVSYFATVSSISPPASDEASEDRLLGSSSKVAGHSRQEELREPGYIGSHHPTRVSSLLSPAEPTGAGPESAMPPRPSSGSMNRIHRVKESPPPSRRTRRRRRPRVPYRTTSRRRGPPTCSSSVYSQ
ncbi:hypothetical protein JDV02_000431 [Purpureocillium takamizusanense]|uniref:Uncharacterized protein n=1 Tax=Purpureocillium takamizusanense TaxID=2060973 RepID=A0A9Q8V6E5_9HYPO|nr:uncharacterized protein JDV02_000431 [Purpureocillium takamizusanense]UNI13712.1 hypothetical protein JDV02_000431 [Purpureocillium takamizusanense]